MNYLLFDIDSEMASDQALAQLASIGVTLAIAALGGTVTGLFFYHCSMNQTNPKTKLNICMVRVE